MKTKILEQPARLPSFQYTCWLLTLVLLNLYILDAFADSVDPDQLAEANWSGSALFAL